MTWRSTTGRQSPFAAPLVPFLFRSGSGVGGHKWVIREFLDARAFDTSLALLASVVERPAA